MATGILESLWHITSAEAPAGDIGKLSDEDIAEHIDCGVGHEKLIAGLIGSGWLDLHPDHRLVVHDWHDHADDATKKRLERSKTPFASCAADNGGQRRTTAAGVGQNPPALALPEPCQSQSQSQSLAAPAERTTAGDDAHSKAVAAMTRWACKEGHGDGNGNVLSGTADQIDRAVSSLGPSIALVPRAVEYHMAKGTAFKRPAYAASCVKSAIDEKAWEAKPKPVPSDDPPRRKYTPVCIPIKQ